jgi:hypothetical protein
MLKFKDMRFPIDVILVFIRWDAAYPLSYRHLKEMMEERACRLTIRRLTDPQSASCQGCQLATDGGTDEIAQIQASTCAQAPHRETLGDQ